jgi:NifU-like protein involved in Fe-S cluster formation
VLEDLYTKDVLRLATSIPNYGRLENAQGSSTQSSKVCGSSVTIDVILNEGRVLDFGIEVSACALGQASSAILGQQAIGLKLENFQDGLRQFQALLKDQDDQPLGVWENINTLKGVSGFPPRHESVLLPFWAMCHAIEAALAAA